MSVLPFVAGSRPIVTSGVWAARHPEWWTLAISAAAWLILVVGASENATPLCTGARPSPAWDATLGWTIMTLAMMPPLVMPAVRHVGFRSRRERRHVAIAEFLAGYLGIWLMAGAGLVGVVLAAAAVRTGADPLVVTLLAYAAAAAWQFTPAKRRALWRCHRVVPLALDGLRADLCCLRYGAGIGLDCIASCWLLMALPLVTPHGLAATTCVQAAMVAERYQRTRYPRRAWPAALLGAALALALWQGAG